MRKCTFSLLNKEWKCCREAWTWSSYELHSLEKGHIQSGQLGFPRLLYKALSKSRSMDCTLLQGGLLGSMFGVGEWALVCC